MVKIYQVGGCIRDKFLGLEPKDIDYAVEASSFEEMAKFIEERGQIYLKKEDTFTIRARLDGIDADFTLCRKERNYTNKRKPDIVEVGTLYDDISRRDFTCNAIAMDNNGNIIDHFNGIQDIKDKILRCVGSTKERLEEDGLRTFRALRFHITKQMEFVPELKEALQSDWIIDIIKMISTERIRQEMIKCFEYSTLETLQVLEEFPKIREYMLSVLWLIPTTKKKSKKNAKMFVKKNF